MTRQSAESAAARTAAIPGRWCFRRSYRGRRLCIFAFLAAAIAGMTGWSLTATAQPYPNRSVRIIVGQTPGTPPDNISRIVAERLSELWHQSVMVENRSGAGGTIAADLVAKASPDGYTLLMGGQSNLAVAVALDPTRRYDPLTQFAPIGRIASTPFFVVVNATVPVKTIPELISFARAHPGRLTFVSYGDATVSRMAFKLLMAETGIDLVEIPYKGSAQALADHLAGRVDIGLNDLTVVGQHVAAGTLRVLGAAGAKRAAFAPDVPTVAEQGVAGFKVEAWYGLVAPAGVAPEVLASLSDALNRIRRMPEMRTRIEKFDYEPIFDDPAQFAAVIQSDIDTYSRVMKRAGISAERKAGDAAQ